MVNKIGTIDQVKTAMEDNLAAMGAPVEITFISIHRFSIASEDERSFRAAQQILALANQRMTDEEYDRDCGYFAYYRMM
jgi:hypothetical protein